MKIQLISKKTHQRIGQRKQARRLLRLMAGTTISACSLSIGGCTSELGSEGDATIDLVTQDFKNFGTTFSQGMVLRHDKMNGNNLTWTDVVGLTACDPKAIYVVQRVTGGWSLWFSNDSGDTFKNVGSTWGPEIACDHGMLMALHSSSKRLYTTTTKADGTIVSGWTDRGQAGEVDRIQGGDGTFYGVKETAPATYKVYTSTNRASLVAPDWGSSIATIGAVQVSGMGATRTGSDNQQVSSSAAWPRRAFALQPDGRLLTNDKLLDGNNSWTFVDIGSERYRVVSAAATRSKTDPNVLFALQDRNGDGTIDELNRIRFAEDSCFDGVDNDANGLKDEEDPECQQEYADDWCASHADGKYCSSRYRDDWTGGALVQCGGGIALSIKEGVCKQSGTKSDYLPSFTELRIPEPSGYGRWCNAHWPSGGWAFTWGGSDPCKQFKDQGGTVVRAGVYDTTGKNQVMANCSDDWEADTGNGDSAMNAVFAAIKKGANRCIFTVAPQKLPIFERLFDDNHEVANRLANGFVHRVNSGPVYINRFGRECSATEPCIGEPAYDHALNEGRPVFAVADGRVMSQDGSRDRNLSSKFNCGGTPNQGEIFVEHRVGESSTFRENFVVGYAHLRKRLVKSGQTVKKGQILGYVGGSGCTGGYTHLHTGVLRLTNVNARGTGSTTADAALGWHLDDYAPDPNSPSGDTMGGANTIDPLGWAGSGEDPHAYLNRNKQDPNYSWFIGWGAWSMELFKSGHAFDYP